ncbi:MAG: hypothetical protein QOJ99_254 [Bryobacterales bacterium]|nr:hypothetical protein [Bryobacterales bacterium]
MRSPAGKTHRSSTRLILHNGCSNVGMEPDFKTGSIHADRSDWISIRNS